MTPGTDTIFFIQKSHIPQGCTFTYGRIVVAYGPQKDNPYQTRLTIGQDHLHYSHDASTSTADITTIKLILNSTISTPNAQFLTISIKNYYLGTPLDQYEYIHCPISIIMNDIDAKYNLNDLAGKDRWVYMEIKKGIYGLKQARKLAYKLLTLLLDPYGYHPCQFTSDLLQYK